MHTNVYTSITTLQSYVNEIKSVQILQILLPIQKKSSSNLVRYSLYEHSDMIQGMNVSQTYGDSSSESASAHNPMNRPNLDAPAPAKERRPQNLKFTKFKI
jgi:hypothetical protein